MNKNKCKKWCCWCCLFDFFNENVVVVVFVRLFIYKFVNHACLSCHFKIKTTAKSDAKSDVVEVVVEVVVEDVVVVVVAVFARLYL